MRLRMMNLWPLVAAGAACGGSSSPTGPGGGTPSPSGPLLSVAMTDYTFTPTTPSIKAGTTVTWSNGGTVGHTATSDPGDALTWDSQSIGPPGRDPYGGPTPGGSYSFTFTKPGTYPYHCTFHGTSHGMTGSITVTP